MHVPRSRRNLAIYTIEKLQQLGARVVACSESGGYVHDEFGIDLDLLKQVKEVERLLAAEYGAAGNYVLGANIVGFVRVAETMDAFGRV